MAVNFRPQTTQQFLTWLLLPLQFSNKRDEIKESILIHRISNQPSYCLLYNSSKVSIAIGSRATCWDHHEIFAEKSEAHRIYQSLISKPIQTPSCRWLNNRNERRSASLSILQMWLFFCRSGNRTSHIWPLEKRNVQKPFLFHKLFIN